MTRWKKNAMALLLCLALLLALPGGAALADGARLSLSGPVEAAPGETVSVSVQIDGNPGIMFLQLAFSYDEQRLEPPVFQSGDWKGWQFGTGAAWGGSGNVTADGSLFTMRFHVRDDAPEGEAEIAFALVSAFNEQEEEVLFETQPLRLRILGKAEAPAEENPGQTTAPQPVRETPTVRLLGCSLTLDERIGLNYYLELPDGLFDQGGSCSVDGQLAPLSDFELRPLGGRTALRVRAEVSSAELEEEHVLKVFGASGQALRLLQDGEDVTESGIRFSAAEYIRRALLRQSPDELTLLLHALDDFGSCARCVLRGEELSAPLYGVSEGLDGESLADFAPVLRVRGDAGLRWLGTSLSLREGTALRLYFRPTQADPASLRFRLNGEELRPENVGDLLCVETPGIPPARLGETQVLRVSGPGGETVLELRISVMSYVCQVLGDEGAEAPLRDFASALARYSRAAGYYFKRSPSGSGS